MKLNRFVMFILLVGAAGCATTQDVRILDQRLAAVEQYRIEMEKERAALHSRLKAIDQTSTTAEQDLRSNYAGAQAELDALRNDLRVVNGKLEELGHTLQQLKGTDKDAEGTLDRLEKTLIRNGERIRRIEQYLNLEPAESGKTPGAADETTSGGPMVPETPKAVRPLSEEELYKTAKQAFDAGNYQSARLGFQNFLKTYPKSSEADNARFWIGETYFREKWYEKALLEYEDVITKYPKGNKVSDAMWKQGMSFYLLGDKPNARVVFEELIKKHPKSRGAELAKKQLEKW